MKNYVQTGDEKKKNVIQKPTNFDFLKKVKRIQNDYGNEGDEDSCMAVQKLVRRNDSSNSEKMNFRQ